jgi:hypothetical protein
MHAEEVGRVRSTGPPNQAMRRREPSMVVNMTMGLYGIAVGSEAGRSREVEGELQGLSYILAAFFCLFDCLYILRELAFLAYLSISQ